MEEYWKIILIADFQKTKIRGFNSLNFIYIWSIVFTNVKRIQFLS